METEAIIEMILLTIIMLATIFTNIMTLVVLSMTDYLRNINRVYLYSVTVSDLLLGLLVFPFALYCAIINELGYSGIDPKICHLQAYFTIMFFLSGIYATAWLNVDHYVAVRKPEHYKVMMSPHRSSCWISFAWIAAISFCCPPLLNFRDTQYYQQVYICTVQIGTEMPYFITAGVLALMPPILSLIVTNVYLFTHGFKKKQKMYECVMLDVSSRPKNYQMNFLISIIFIGTWLPWCVLRICSLFDDMDIPRQLHFYTFWLAMSNSFYKFFVYIGMSIEYRRGLCEIFQHCGKCTCCQKCCVLEQPNPNPAISIRASRVVMKPSTSAPHPTVV